MPEVYVRVCVSYVRMFDGPKCEAQVCHGTGGKPKPRAYKQPARTGWASGVTDICGLARQCGRAINPGSGLTVNAMSTLGKKNKNKKEKKKNER